MVSAPGNVLILEQSFETRAAVVCSRAEALIMIGLVYFTGLPTGMTYFCRDELPEYRQSYRDITYRTQEHYRGAGIVQGHGS